VTEARSELGTALVAHPGAELYGSDRVLLESVSALIESGWRTVVTLPTDGPLRAELQKRGARVVHCPTPVLRKSALRPLGMLRLARETVRGFLSGWRLLTRERPQAIYVNTITIPLWQVLGKLRRIPVLAHVHEGEASASNLVQAMLALPLFLCDIIVANSRFSAGVVERRFPRLASRVQVVYNGVPGPPHASPGRPRLDGPIQLTYIGRLSPRKGVDVAIDAVSVLSARGVHANLDVVGGVFPGTEWYEQQLIEQVKSGDLEEQVRFHGFRPCVWDVVAAGDVVVVPSRLDEPFGDTAVEAILSRRPVIASATSGLLEATAGYATATTVTPDNAQALADAVEQTVEGWTTAIAAAETDAELARRRHGPEEYRARISQLIARLVADHR